MQERNPPLSPDLIALIQRTVEELMNPYGLASVAAKTGLDHDGDPVILVDAEYEDNGNPIDPEVMAELTLTLPHRLLEAGESRFPHIRHHFDERREVKRLRRRTR